MTPQGYRDWVRGVLAEWPDRRTRHLAFIDRVGEHDVEAAVLLQRQLAEADRLVGLLRQRGRAQEIADGPGPTGPVEGAPSKGGRGPPSGAP